MWKIENPTIQKTKLDFTSSGQDSFEVSQLISDKIVMMNAIEFLEFDDDSVQLLICNQCGTVGCQSGNWVCFRKSSELILMIPAFDKMSDDWSKNEYSPPRYFKKEGTPYFDLETYKKLQSEISLFPSVEKIKSLEMREAMRLVQVSFPMQIFGEPPRVEIHREKSRNVVAASEDEPKINLQRIEAILKQNYENKSFAKLRHTNSDDEIIYLFIDDVEFSDRQALVRKEFSYNLLLESDFVIEETSINNLI